MNDKLHPLVSHLQAAAPVLAEGQKPEELLGLALQTALELSEAQAGAIAGIDPAIYAAKHDLAESLFIQAAQNLDLLSLAAEQQLAVSAALEGGASRGAGFTAMPLRAGGQTVGLLWLDKPASPTSPDLTLLASQAALYISRELLARQLNDVTQAKAKFVSVVTHELRIPMTSIKGYTEMMRKGMVGAVNEMQGQFLGIIHNNVERMSALVSDLSDLSHIEGGKLKLRIEPLSVASAVIESTHAYKPKIEEKGQTLQLDLPEDLPKASGEYGRVVQVINAMVNNAWRYTLSGGQVKVRAFVEGGCVRVEVIDTGIGISPEDQARLFSQFFRSDDTVVREEPGWGLALSVAKKLVELMDGEIGAQSTLKEGSTFWFTLPVAGAQNG